MTLPLLLGEAGAVPAALTGVCLVVVVPVPVAPAPLPPSGADELEPAARSVAVLSLVLAGALVPKSLGLVVGSAGFPSVSGFRFLGNFPSLSGSGGLLV